MSFFKRIFGLSSDGEASSMGKSNKKSASTSAQNGTEQAIGRIRDTEDILLKKQSYLEGKIERETSLARQHANTKNKRMAIQALRRRKQYEQQLEQISGTLSTMDTQRASLENASTNAEVLDVMGQSAKALKAAHKNMDAEKVHDLMDDISEQQTVAAEISEAISNPISFGLPGTDDNDLEAELEELAAEMADEELLKISSTADLPVLPGPSTATPAPAKEGRKLGSKSDEDMKALENWALA